MQRQKDTVAALVLAAGKGTRMKSQLPKVLHPLCGVPMLGHVIATLTQAGIDAKCIVVGGEVELLQTYLKTFGELTYALQRDRLGTGEAVACGGFGIKGVRPPEFASGSLLAGPQIESPNLLICAGDTPAMDAATIRGFIANCLTKQLKLAVLGMNHPEPRGYGRLICQEGNQLVRIVEEKDASEAEKKLGLCNSGVIFANTEHLFSLLGALTKENAQREYYLTDCFALSLARGVPAEVWVTDDYASFDGINDRLQLANLEGRMLDRIRRRWMSEGVSFLLPASCYIETSVTIGADSVIGPQVSLFGKTQIGRNCEIGSHVSLKDVIIPDGTRIEAGTVRGA